VNIHKPRLLECLDPLDLDCKCSACENYSEAYIAHLINCHEMTGKVLLTIHNVFQYLKCFPQ
jgi:queuine tRNA-ribosyltransferase